MKNANLPKIFPKIFVILAILASFGVGFLVDRRFFSVQETPEPPSCPPPQEKLYVDNVYQDEKIKSIIIDKLGVHPNDIQGLELRFSDKIKDSEDTYGVYSHGRSIACVAKEAPKILIKSGLSDRDQLVTIAHEFAHHYWHLPWFDLVRINTEQDLILLYHKDSNFRKRVDEHYTNRGKLKLTELFAVACTEFPDNALTENIIHECNRVLPKRDVLGLN